MNARTQFQKGFTLIEVLVGILVFALGMMALAQLQGSLGKSSTDANARTVALNIAEEEIEAVRSFSQITASETVDAFNNIVSGTKTVSRGGIDYTVVTTVSNYYFNPNTEAFQTTKPHADIINADLKRLQVNVAWGVGDSAISFQIDQSNATTELGTGSVSLVDLISSFTTSSGAKVVYNSAADGLYSPPVDYNPGENPEIISIQLGANKFKESTTPLPDVIRLNELVETRFDVVTYSQNDDGATFLRREEFRAVSCECRLRIPSGADQGGFRPAVWDGTEYTAGEFLSKPYGESASMVQSIYCGMCCRDHHDGGSGEDDDPYDPGRSKYNPFRDAADYHDGGSLAGDHKHYRRDRSGNLVLAENSGDLYVEACRMVRKDGFFKIAQDLRQEGFNAFPGDFLDDEAEVSEYSSYVTDAVSDYEFAIGADDAYELSPPSLTRPQDMSPAVVFPASNWDVPTQMMEGGVTEQQLRSRGIYIDYMSDLLRTRVNCLDLGGEGADCGTPEVTSALEIIPFFDVQLTWLSRWNESPTGYPIDVTNQALQDDNAHSRGVATLEGGEGPSVVSTEVHRGNLGLTGTDPVDPRFGLETTGYPLYAVAGEFGDGPPLSGIIISGSITSSVSGVRAADVEIEGQGAVCDRTLTGYECNLIMGDPNPRLKIFNYAKGRQEILGCSDVLVTLGVSHVSVGGENWTRFRLPKSTTTGADIILRLESCL